MFFDIKSLLLTLLSSSWGVVTVFLIGAVVYRGVLSTREDDQIFIDDAEQGYSQEQQAIIARMSQLNGPIIALSLASGILFLTTMGVWIYQGFSSF
jgi:non-ribosomal peptide synthetase component F